MDIPKKAKEYSPMKKRGSNHGNSKIDFDQRLADLSLSSSLSLALLDAHSALYGHVSQETKYQTWRAIRKLAVFLHEIGQEKDEQFPTDILQRFYDWLPQNGLAGSTCQSHFNIIRIVIGWCARNRSALFDGVLIPEARGFVRQTPKSLPPIDGENAKKIMHCALNEISKITERIEAGRLELEIGKTKRAILIRRLLEIGEGLFPSQEKVTYSKESLLRKVKEAGGLRELWACIFPCTSDLLPFYIAIQFQLAGNPHAVARMDRKCIVSNPLREDREWVEWEKPRSSKKQRADFPSAKDTSAPSLIRKLLKLTDPLVEFAGSNKNHLFLCYANGRCATPNAQTWHNNLNEFISEHNLPPFDFIQLRKTSAVLHHKATGSIIAAKKKLNHESVATTHRYTTFNDLADEHERRIGQAQNDLLITVTAPHKLNAATLSDQQAAMADTVFGFLCKDPIQGYGNLQGKKGPCDQFFRCATCSGAIVPLDRVDIVATLLQSRRFLLDTKERAISEGWLPRYTSLYQPTLNVLEAKLLPNVAPHVMEQAEAIIMRRPFPVLE